MASVLKFILRLCAAAPLVVAAACNGDKPKGDGEPKPASVPNPEAPAESPKSAEPETSTSTAHTRLLPWLDPAAISVGYFRLPQMFDPHAVGVVYALPPRAEDILGAPHDVNEAIEAMQPTDAPALGTWLGPEALVTLGRFAQRPLVLRPLLVPRPQVAERLEAMGLTHQEDDEVFDRWEPTRVFPYRVVLLDGDVAAFLPTSEPGSGMGPLTAARDMPSSDIETQLRDVLDAPGGPVAAVFAAGPMMHFDLDMDVLAVRFEVRRLADGALDGQSVLQLDGDPAKAISALTGRKAPEMNDRVQELMGRTAFVVDAGVVAGRLQISASDAVTIYEEP